MPAVLKCVLLALVMVAAIYDYRFRRIPNWLNLSGVVVGLGVNTLLFATHGFWAAFLGMLLALGLYVPLYLLRAMGAGDAKLMSAVGSVVGPQNWLLLFVCTALAGGMLALAFLLWKRRLAGTVANVAVLANELVHLRAPSRRHNSLDVRNEYALRLPHGVSIAAGSLAFLFLRPIFHL